MPLYSDNIKEKGKIEKKDLKNSICSQTYANTGCSNEYSAIISTGLYIKSKLKIYHSDPNPPWILVGSVSGCGQNWIRIYVHCIVVCTVFPSFPSKRKTENIMQKY